MWILMRILDDFRFPNGPWDQVYKSEASAFRVQGGCREGARRVQGWCKEGARRPEDGAAR